MPNLVRFLHGSIVLLPEMENKRLDIINVVKATYSENIMAYFIKSIDGTLLFVNDALTAKQQARAISVIKENIKNCGAASTGLLTAGYKYTCGGKCCNK